MRSLRCKHSFQRQFSYKIAWGAPVPPLLAHDGQSHSLHGMAGGVAALANIPLRFPLQPVEPAVYDTTRLMECFVKVGPIKTRAFRSATPTLLTPITFSCRQSCPESACPRCPHW